MLIKFYDKDKNKLHEIVKGGSAFKKMAKNYIAENKDVAYYTTTTLHKIPKNWKGEQ